MSDFKAKRHEIRFRLGLCPRPRWKSLLHSPRFIAGGEGPYGYYSVNTKPVKRLPSVAAPAFYIGPHAGWNYEIVTPFL